MGGPSSMMKSAQVAMIAFALAVISNAAPITEPSLFEQQAQLYNEMLLQDTADAEDSPDAPFSGSDVQDKQLGVYHQHNTTVSASKAYLAAEVKSHFKIAADRDAAEKKTRAEQAAKIATKLKAYRESQNKTAHLATEAQKAATTKEKQVVDAQTQKVHDIIHTEKPKVEEKNKAFLASMAKVAEGTTVVTAQGDQFKPGGLGDVAPVKDDTNSTSLPTAAEMELAEADKMIDPEETAMEEMKQEEDAFYEHSQALFEEVLGA